MCQKCDLFQAFLGASLIHLDERVAGSDEKEKWMERVPSIAKPHSVTEPLRLQAQDLVAIYLENGNLYRFIPREVQRGVSSE